MNNLLTKFRNQPIRYLLAALFLFLPFERIPSIDVGGVTVRLDLVIGLALIVIALWSLTRTRPHLSRGVMVVLGLLGLFLIWSIALIPFSLNPSRALHVVVFTLFTVGLGLSSALLLRRDDVGAIVKATWIGAGIVGVFALYQYFGNILGVSNALTGLRPQYSWELFGFPRIQSTSLEPLYFAAYLLMPLSLIGAFILEQRQRTWRLPLLLLLVSTCLFLTVSRGGYAGLIAALVALVVVGVWRRVTSWPAIATLLAIALLGFGISFLLISKINKPASLSAKKSTGAHSYTRQIQTTGLEGGGDERAQGRRLAVQLFKSHPLTGVGPGNYGPAVQPPGSTIWTIVNNEPLELLAETGAVGFTLFAGFALGLFVLALLALRRLDGILATTLHGAIAYLAALGVQYQTYSTLYIIQVWAGIGLALGLILLSHAKPIRSKSRS